MDTSMYLSQEDGEKYLIPYDYKQTFAHESRIMQTPKEYTLVREFYNYNDERQTIELEILKYLRDFGFATITQMRTLLGAKGINPDRLEDVLESCEKDRVVNYFTLSTFVMEDVPEDAFRIYCLDHGARHILTHFSSSDFLSWLSTDNIRSSELIAKYLMTGMFYLQVIAARGDSVREFNPLADFSIGKRDIRFSGTFQIMDGYTPRNFIFEVIRHDDLPTMWRQKVNEKIAPFVLNKFWELYYETLPVFIFLTQNDKDAFEVGQIFYRRTHMTDFRMLTDKNLVKGLGVAPFYSYVPESEKNPTPSMKRMKARIFMTKPAENK